MKKVIFSILTASIVSISGSGAFAALSAERYSQIVQNIRAACAGTGTNCAAVVAAARVEVQSIGGQAALSDAQLSGLVSVVTESVASLPASARPAVGIELGNIADVIENEAQRQAARTVSVFVGSGDTNNQLDDTVVAVLGSPN
jgi:hypothetical protein